MLADGGTCKGLALAVTVLWGLCWRWFSPQQYWREMLELYFLTSRTRVFLFLFFFSPLDHV